MSCGATHSSFASQCGRRAGDDGGRTRSGLPASAQRLRRHRGFLIGTNHDNDHAAVVPAPCFDAIGDRLLDRVRSTATSAPASSSKKSVPSTLTSTTGSPPCSGGASDTGSTLGSHTSTRWAGCSRSGTDSRDVLERGLGPPRRQRPVDRTPRLLRSYPHLGGMESGYVGLLSESSLAYRDVWHEPGCFGLT